MKADLIKPVKKQKAHNNDWRLCLLGNLLTIKHGKSQRGVADEHGKYPILASGGQIGTSNSFLYEGPSVLIGRKGTIDHPQYVDEPFWSVDTLFYSIIHAPNHPKYLFYQFCMIDWTKYNEASGVPSLNAQTIQNIFVRVPSPDQQILIAGTLSDADALIESLEQLIAKKRQIKQGAMQELLTGKRRLPGFTRQWQIKKIDEIAVPTSERNDAALDLPVLTCSKHLGFVDSLRFFKNQVFGDDLSVYKLIRRGQIGYPANHVEEGSIGHQDLYNVALVSPIYVVFSVKDEVDSFFLHRVLKLDSYRQKFKTATTSSIDRRGSLRWPTFSQIEVAIPELGEQEAIAGVLSDMDADIAALDDKLNKARQIKQGMMQELLTGRIRLV